MTLQIIKRTVFTTVACIMFAGGASARMSDPIELPGRRITISELFRQIERQTGNVVVVRSNTVDNTRTVDLPKTSGTVHEILSGALAGTGTDFQISDGYIIIGTRPQAASEPVALREQPRQSIIIDESELKRFAAEPRMAADSVVQRPKSADDQHFTAPNKVFRTPGKTTPEGRISERMTTAPRVQRSKFALKTNLLYGFGTLTPNLRAELGLGNRTSLEAGLAYNGWNLNGTVDNNKKLVHGVGLAEFRYWLCERFDGHYFGFHGFGGFYNVGGRDIPLLFEKEFRYEGTMFGAGISYGYMLPLSPRWGVEFNVGVGVAQFKYDKYGCDKCDQLEGTYSKTYFGPTRAAINLVFIIK